jgi:hypothetical protein
MDAIAQFVADAILGTDTLWGGDVMCPSGTGRFIADSWFSDEPLPAAYSAPAAARVRACGGVAGKKVDRPAVEEYLAEVDIPQAIAGVRDEARKIGALRAEQVARTAAFAVRVSSPGTSREQAHGDDEISIRTKRTPQPRHGATLQNCGHDCDRKDADRNIGGPRYPLC